MPEIAVVHLVRAKNGIEPFKTFIESYRRCNGGIEHDLIVLFKGFRSERDISEYRRLLKDVQHRSLRLLDYGFDIRAYFVAVRKYTYTYFCFLNSFSVLLDSLWLAKLHACLTRPGIGLVGATGSAESSYTANVQVPEPVLPFFGQLRRNHWLKRLAAQFDPFPNYHIRTNGFMISRKILDRVQPSGTLSKMDAHRFESGRTGLTKRVMGMGMGVRVVGKDGTCYAPEVWHSSNTFRTENQQNLMIADNQTRSYIQSDVQEQRRLTLYAWGNLT